MNIGFRQIAQLNLTLLKTIMQIGVRIKSRSLYDGVRVKLKL